MRKRGRVDEARFLGGRGWSSPPLSFVGQSTVDFKPYLHLTQAGPLKCARWRLAGRGERGGRSLGGSYSGRPARCYTHFATSHSLCDLSNRSVTNLLALLPSHYEPKQL
jgi:hypothetical protein